MTRHLRYYLLIAAMIAIAIGAIFLRPHEINSVIFKDVTAGSGLESYTGMTYGAAWGDFDGDGRPDLYVTNHWKSDGAKLFRNTGKGHFEDVTDKLFNPQELTGDKHGAVWADFDNDGRLDLVQMTGGGRGIGSEPKRLFVNRGTKFEDMAEALGVSNPYGRARMPLWYDFNRDGFLDLFEGAESRLDKLEPPYVFLHQDGKFGASTDVMKFASRSPKFCIITVLNNDSSFRLGVPGSREACDRSGLRHGKLARP